MPKGQYDRSKAKPHIFSEEAKERLRENMTKAREVRRKAGYSDSPEAKAAKSANAGKAIRVRVARAILKNCPLGAEKGTIFKTGGLKSFEVIDPGPVLVNDRWEQRFMEIVRVKLGGNLQEFRNKVKVVWNYHPDASNLMEMPELETMEEEEK